MNLHPGLAEHHAGGGTLRVALIGAGRIGALFLAQVPRLPGLDVAVIADADPERARAACRAGGWPEARISATIFTDSGLTAAEADVHVVVEATDSALAGIAHVRAALAAGTPVVLANAEADALAGPALAQAARAAGLVCSMAAGSRAAQAAELVDRARAAGFAVAAAGAGARHLPAWQQVTPDDVWRFHPAGDPSARAQGVPSPSARAATAELDGTAAAIEAVIIANACGLDVPKDGLALPPCGADDLAHVLRPRRIGGQLAGEGVVEFVATLERDGRPVARALHQGAFAVLRAGSDMAAAGLHAAGLRLDETGRYGAIHAPFHLPGLDLARSVLSVALWGAPTGSAQGWQADAVALAKRALQPGDVLDGAGGHAVRAEALPAIRARRMDALPIGLSAGLRVRRAVAAGSILTLQDVDIAPDHPALTLRRDMAG